MGHTKYISTYEELCAKYAGTEEINRRVWARADGIFTPAGTEEVMLWSWCDGLMHSLTITRFPGEHECFVANLTLSMLEMLLEAIHGSSWMNPMSVAAFLVKVAEDHFSFKR